MCRLILTLCVIGAIAASVSADTVSIVGAVPMPDGRIVGGEDALIREYPHQISMRFNGNHRCGGSIYSPNVIVSAAHCVVGVSASALTIVAGSTLLSEKAQEVSVALIIIHEKYKTYNNDNDVAILILNGELKLNNNVQPIALASKRPDVGSEAIVTGWGTQTEGASTIPNQLQQVTVNVLKQETCRSAYLILLTGRMICAGVNGGGKDACQGDSGGPLISAENRELIGIVSWGIGCARDGYPGVYASVPELRDWIISKVKTYAVQPDIAFL